MHRDYYSPADWEKIITFSNTKETPFLVVLLDRVRKKFDEFRTDFPNAKIYYACRVEGKSAREMARRFKISRSAVWTRMSRAQDILDQYKDEFL